MYWYFINAHLFELIFFSAWQQSDAAANETAGSGIGSPVSNLVSRLGSFTFRRTSSGRVETATDSESDEAASVGGSFFETLTSSEFYKNTKVIFCCTVFKNSYNLEARIKLNTNCATVGWRYLRELPVGTISCTADVWHIPYHVAASV